MLVANCARAPRRAAPELDGAGIRVAIVVKNLGVDSAPGARSSTATQRVPTRKMTAKAGRLARIRGPSQLKRVPACAVLINGGLYGSEAVGTAGGQLRKLCVAMATAVYGPCRGRRCLTTCLAAYGAKDPAVALAERRVLQ